MEHKYCLVATTFNNAEQAHSLARQALEQKLAACAQIIQGVSSLYYWQGKLESAEEYLLQFKTASKQADLLMNFIKQQHVYELPEIIMIRIAEMDADYGKWLEASLNPDIS